MPLNWNAERIKFFQENPDDLYVDVPGDNGSTYSDLNVVTKSLVFGTMSVGIGDLTFKNAPDYYARWKMLEEHDGYYLYGKVNDEGDFVRFYLTPEIIMQHIGLATNVSHVSKKEWVTRLAKAWANEKDGQGQFTIKNLSAEYDKKRKEFENSFTATV